MAGLKEKYIVDETGKRTAVLLDIKEYNKLKERLEDYKDRLELQKAKKAAKKFTLLEHFIRELKGEANSG